MAQYRIVKISLHQWHGGSDKPFQVQKRFLFWWVDCELGDEHAARFKTIEDADDIRGESGGYIVIKTISV